MTAVQKQAADDNVVEVHVGSHFFRWEPPDLMYIAYSGDVDGETMSRLSKQTRSYTVGRPRVFLVVEMSKVGRMSGEARRVSSQGAKDVTLRGIAVVGASPHVRVVASLVTRAVDILQGNKENPTRFFDTEQAARAWIDTRRKAVG